MQNSGRVKRGFDLLSSSYDTLSKLFFGGMLMKAQTYFIPELQKHRSILIFGGGTGKILIELMKNKTGDDYCYVDISEKMIRLTKNRIEGMESADKVKFICGSYQDIPNEKFDLVITPFVLDCFDEEQLAVVMKTLGDKISPTGKWLFTDFHIPAKGMTRVAAKATTRILYFFFNLFCKLGTRQLPDFEKAFATLNYCKQKEKNFMKEMLVTRIYSRQ